MKIKKGDLVKIISGRIAAETPPAEQPPRRVTEVLDGGAKVIEEIMENDDAKVLTY